MRFVDHLRQPVRVTVEGQAWPGVLLAWRQDVDGWLGYVEHRRPTSSYFGQDGQPEILGTFLGWHPAHDLERA